MNTTPFYISAIKNHLQVKQQSNPAYSLRAYARDLGMSHSTISHMLSGKRALPVEHLYKLCDKLQLDPIDKTRFIDSISVKTTIDQIKLPLVDERYILDDSFYKIIAEWEHYALIEMFQLDDFEPTTNYITKKLKITTERASEVLKNLMTCGLISQNEKGDIVVEHPKYRTTEDVKSKALRASHLEALEMGKAKLDEVAVELRDFSSVTLAVDLEKVPEAKMIIREFRQKMIALLDTSKKSDVFQLAIQFYPMTDTEADKVKQ